MEKAARAYRRYEAGRILGLVRPACFRAAGLGLLRPATLSFAAEKDAAASEAAAEAAAPKAPVDDVGNRHG